MQIFRTDFTLKCVFFRETEVYRFAIASPDPETIKVITRNWKSNHGLHFFVLRQRSRPFEVFVDKEKGREAQIQSIIRGDLDKYYREYTGKKNRAFIDLSGEILYCTAGIGCIPMSLPYDEVVANAKRKIPESIDKIDPHFWLYDNTGKSEIDLPSEAACFSAKSHPVYFIIHGFTDHGNKQWVQTMKDELLNRDNECSVVVVDWEDGAKWFGPFNYYQAAVNTYAMGAITAFTIQKFFTSSSCNAEENLHIIGHSLGAHVAGFTGSSYLMTSNKRLGKITGLDPAGPWFGDRGPERRLDKSDARYVEILHTSARRGDQALTAIPAGWNAQLGIKYPAGHVDFYVNGGVLQPHCSEKRSGCSHRRAYEYMTESISSDCKFIGFKCNGKTPNAQVESCINAQFTRSQRAVMGLYTPKRERIGIYYVEVNDAKSDFCNKEIQKNYPTYK